MSPVARTAQSAVFRRRSVHAGPSSPASKLPIAISRARMFAASAESSTARSTFSIPVIVISDVFTKDLPARGHPQTDVPLARSVPMEIQTLQAISQSGAGTDGGGYITPLPLRKMPYFLSSPWMCLESQSRRKVMMFWVRTGFPSWNCFWRSSTCMTRALCSFLWASKSG